MEVKKWYASRTVWIAVAQAVAGILAALLETNPSLQGVGVIFIVKSALDLALRISTTQPII